jgi:hypothetical protein
MSVFGLVGMNRLGRRRMVVACLVAAMATSVLAEAGVSAASGSAATPGHGDAVAAKKKKKKKCKRGYKLVTVKVKRKKRGKTVTVRVKKCRKAKAKSKGVAPPATKPGPPAPTPSPSPAGPKIDQVLGWSTIAQDPDTPPADLTADGGTITSCPSSTSLSVYLRRSGFTAIGQVSHTWKRDGVVIAAGSNSSTFNGAFRHGITISPVNGVYEITWTSAGAPIGSAKVTRNC